MPEIDEKAVWSKALKIAMVYISKKAKEGDKQAELVQLQVLQILYEDDKNE